MAYVEEFYLVDRGFAISILHRYSKSGMVKFLAIGGSKHKGRDPGLTKDENPVPYLL